MISNETKELIYNVSSSFEGKGFSQVTGNFDGQGISFGFLQWCLGQGSLQPIWKQALSDPIVDTPSILTESQIQEVTDLLVKPKAAQVSWGDSISDPIKKARIVPEWKTALEAWGTATKHIQMQKAESVLSRALGYCAKFNLKSIRSLSFMFDVCVQNGSIQDDIIWSIKRRLAQEPHHSEPSTLLLILEQRLEKCKPQWREDVRNRKECIINGSGWVHEKLRDLEKEYGLSDDNFNE